MSAKKVLLTKSEVMKIKSQCGQLNWSDGGHWQGIGPEPNCFQRNIVSSTSTLIYKFPTDKAAFKWNAENEKAIRMVGHGVTIGISIAVGLTTVGWGGVAAGSIAGIFKDEIQAQVSYPKVARNWTYTLVFRHTYNQSILNQSKFTQEITGTVRDHKQMIIWTKVNTSEFNMNSFPESVARELVSIRPTTKSITYQ